MKRMVLSLFLGVSAGILSAAPETVNRIGSLIERKTLAWQVSAVKPLTETIPEDFAKQGWRIEFDRPLEGGEKTGVQKRPGPGDPRNIAELILLRGLLSASVPETRSKLTWKAEPGELYTASAYLGRAWDYEIFIRADVATIAAAADLLHAKGGEDLSKVYADALNEEDYGNFTRRTAASLVALGGNGAIPHINRAMGIAIARKTTTAPHFIGLKNIGTPEAAAEFAAAMRSSFPEIADTAEKVLLLPPAMKPAGELYLEILAKRKCVPQCLVAITSLGIGRKALPILDRLAAEPESFVEFADLVFASWKFRTGNRIVPESEIVDRIRLLMARNGDIPGTPKVVSIAGKAGEIEAEMATLERSRVAPLEEEFKKSLNTDCSTVAAVSLCVFSPPPKTFPESYVNRVNAEGLRLLRMIPDRSRVREILRRLRDHAESPAESDYFAGLLRKVM